MNFLSKLRPLLAKYLELKKALVDDNFSRSYQHSLELMKILEDIDMTVFKGESHMVWMKYSKNIQVQIEKTKASTSISELRSSFKPLFEEFILLIQLVGMIDQPLYIEYCPMADNNNGANWISIEPDIRNPYFGASILGCGEVKEEIQ